MLDTMLGWFHVDIAKQSVLDRVTSAACRAWLRYYLAQRQRPFLLLADILLGVIEQIALSMLQALLSAWRRAHRVKACHRPQLGSADLGASALAAGQLSENPMKTSENSVCSCINLHFWCIYFY